MDEAAPGEAGAAAEKKRPLLRRVPTPLIVTLLGIVLTAWLLPAFTRQWDDRQKAHEVKAGIVTEMASATAPALLGGEAIWSGRSFSAKQRQQLGDSWALADLEIEARLRSYFSANVVAAWQIFAWAIDRFIDANHPTTEVALRNVWLDEQLGRIHIDPSVAFKTFSLVTSPWQAPHAPNFKGGDINRLVNELRAANKDPYWDRLMEERNLTKIQTWQQEEDELLQLQQTVADQVINATHVSGYSTTTHDLINDLVP